VTAIVQVRKSLDKDAIEALQGTGLPDWLMDIVTHGEFSKRSKAADKAGAGNSSVTNL